MKKFFFIPLSVLCFSLPFIWLFSSCNPNDYLLYQSEEFAIYPNRVEQGEFSAIAINDKHLISNYPGLENNEWKLSKSISHYPRYESNQLILNGVYNLSLEEAEKNIAEDSTFTTSAKKNGIRTRDISYSIILSLAITNPEIAQKSLLKQVKHGKIMQDKGTGGAWPVSSDRMIWAVASWEVYKTTGDTDWLRRVYFIIKNSIEDDLNVVWDYQKHLFKGESSFLNWREQSYPDWMEPIDIYNSYSLSTQAVHYQSLQILIAMGKLLDKDTRKYEDISAAQKKSINEKMWLDNKNYFGQFIYGRKFHSLSDKPESLGEALLVLWNITNKTRQKKIVAHTPTTKFGIPCFYPQIPNMPAYHNKTTWPFVQAFWNWASAKTENTKALQLGIANMLRSCALFLTNKENLLVSNGDFSGTQINSDQQLWSIAGSLSTVYRIFMGLNFTADYLEFSPIIPREYKGKHSLKNLRYRNAILDIDIYGFGTQISSYSLDGKFYQKAIFPKEIEGKHKVIIHMNNQTPAPSKIHIVSGAVSPETSQLQFADNKLLWNKKENIDCYRVYQNGELLLETKDLYMSEVNITEPVEFQVQNLDKNGNFSFLSEPLYLYNPESERSIEAEQFDVKNKTNYVILSKKRNREFYFTIKIPNPGKYYIDFLYANGSGPITTGSKCGIRSFWVNNTYSGSLVFPQRGKGNWNEYAYSNSVLVQLTKKNNFFKISFENFNQNMDREVNTVRIDKIRLIKTE